MGTYKVSFLRKVHMSVIEIHFADPRGDVAFFTANGYANTLTSIF